MIEARELSKVFNDKKRGAVRAVDSVSFRCEPEIGDATIRNDPSCSHSRMVSVPRMTATSSFAAETARKPKVTTTPK